VRVRVRVRACVCVCVCAKFVFYNVKCSFVRDVNQWFPNQWRRGE
jgi:hypothetical protein